MTGDRGEVRGDPGEEGGEIEEDSFGAEEDGDWSCGVAGVVLSTEAEGDGF